MGSSSDRLDAQIRFANKVILFLRDEIDKANFENDLIEEEGLILKAIFTKIDNEFSDLDLRLQEITPYTRFTHSELFIGGNGEISLLSELKKEILSSDRIDLLVSFIKHKGVIILMDELKEFTRRGGKLRIITTTYVGATDKKAIDLLTELDNTEVKISYNTGNERLHAKAYLFYRNTGYHTAYIGSSNFSRSALTDGLEWNLKVTTKEISHIIDKFRKTFDSYWENEDFSTYNPLLDSDKLSEALSNGKFSKAQPDISAYFDIKPHNYQQLILEKLRVERNIHNRHKNLVVAATGTGKTIISAFDFKYFLQENPKAKLLFVAHRKEILIQALATFKGVLKNNNFGELLVDGIYPKNYSAVFASVQSLNNKIDELNLTESFFDFIIIDEVHHIAASSYRPLLKKFSPKILLGLTATPERMDGADILEDFSNRIAAEIRLPEALNKKLLCPFHYFGISDSIDLSKVKWSKGRYDVSELTKIYTSNDKRVGEIIKNLNYYTKDPSDVRALGFCTSIEHAEYMAHKFLGVNLKAAALTSKNAAERDHLRSQLQRKEINYLFVVDIFNEGVDIPEIDTVLFLRPTESLTIFLQQLGRGLRLTEDKEVLTVLDFVGNARSEYDFEHKFRALIGKSNTSILKEIEDDFPHLPLGCSIVLEKQAKTLILENIKKATTLNINKIIARIQNFKHQSSLSLTLKNFHEFTQIPLAVIYKNYTWNSLLEKAGITANYSHINDKKVQSMIKNKWLSTSSISYFKFILLS
jgi:superfamily II DNA or RNA helicase